MMSETTYKTNQLLKWAVGCYYTVYIQGIIIGTYISWRKLSSLSEVCCALTQERRHCCAKADPQPVQCTLPTAAFPNGRHIIGNLLNNHKSVFPPVRPALLQPAAGLSWTEMVYVPSKLCLLPHPSPQYLLLQMHMGTAENIQIILPAKIKYITCKGRYVVWQRPPSVNSDTSLIKMSDI